METREGGTAVDAEGLKGIGSPRGLEARRLSRALTFCGEGESSIIKTQPSFLLFSESELLFESLLCLELKLSLPMAAVVVLVIEPTPGPA